MISERVQKHGNHSATKVYKTKPSKIEHRLSEAVERIRKRFFSLCQSASTVAELLLQNFFPQFSFKRFWQDLRHKPAFQIAVSVSVLLILFFIAKYLRQPSQEKTVAVEKGDFIVDLIESGEIEALSEQVIAAPETWVEQIQVIGLVPEGTKLKKGDFLVQFDEGDLENQLILTEDQLALAMADQQKQIATQTLQLHNLENQLKLSEYSHEQAKLRLEMSQYESDAKKEEARLQLKQAEINLKRVEQQLASQKIIQGNQRIKMASSLRQVQNQIRELKMQIGRMRITAPTDGIVVYKEVGSWQNRERLKVGYKVRHGEPILSLPDLSKLQVKLYVNEVDHSEILQGQKAEIRLDAYPNVLFHGDVQTVSRLAQNVRWDSKLKGFSVTVQLKESDSRLKPGMSARVRIFLNSLKHVLTVPVGVIFEIEGKPVVFPKGRTKPVFVTLGPRNDERVVVEKGVKPGMKLSWIPRSPKARIYGYAEEKTRINLIAANLEKSLSLFEKQGTIYDYGNPNKTKRRIQDRSDFPGGEDMLRQFIRQRGSSKPIESESGRGVPGQHGRRPGRDSTVFRRSPTEATEDQPPQTKDRIGRERRSFVPGDSGEVVEDGRPFRMTPEMRERVRQWRQRQGSDSAREQGERPFQITPEMRERMRQRRQHREGDISGGVPSDSASGGQDRRHNPPLPVRQE